MSYDLYRYRGDKMWRRLKDEVSYTMSYDWPHTRRAWRRFKNAILELIEVLLGREVIRLRRLRKQRSA